MEFAPRVGYIVWLTDLKLVKNLEKIGTLHYVSKRMSYAVMYFDKNQEKKALEELGKLTYVKTIEPSHRQELRTDYNENEALDIDGEESI